jgi:hypothetical protein
MIGNTNINKYNLRSISQEEMRIYGGGCVDCPTKMPTNSTSEHMSAEEQRNFWLILLGAFLLLPCIGCIVLFCKICYNICRCGNNNDENNYNNL